MTNTIATRLRARGRHPTALAAFGAATLCALTLSPLAHATIAPGGQGDPATPPKPGAVYATLEQCSTSADPNERAATFAGEMATIPGSSKMEMRIDVLERLPLEASFHAVSAPGLGVWRTAAPGVRSYRYLKQVTNLAAPALYRAAVRFRWLNSKGRLIRAVELRTARCQQPAPPPLMEEVTSDT